MRQIGMRQGKAQPILSNIVANAPLLDFSKGILKCVRSEALVNNDSWTPKGLISDLSFLRNSRSNLIRLPRRYPENYFYSYDNRISVQGPYALSPGPTIPGRPNTLKFPWDNTDIIAKSELIVTKSMTVPAGKTIWFGLKPLMTHGCLTSITVIEKSQWDALSESSRIKTDVITDDMIPTEYERRSIFSSTSARLLEGSSAPTSTFGCALRKKITDYSYQSAGVHANGGVVTYTWDTPGPDNDAWNDEFGVLLDFNVRTMEITSSLSTPLGYGISANTIASSGSTYDWSSGDQFVVLLEYRRGLNDNSMVYNENRYYGIRCSGFKIYGWRDPAKCNPAAASPSFLGDKPYCQDDLTNEITNYSENPDNMQFVPSNRVQSSRFSQFPTQKSYVEFVGLEKSVGPESDISGLWGAQIPSLRGTRIGFSYDPTPGPGYAKGRLGLWINGVQIGTDNLNNTSASPGDYFQANERIFSGNKGRAYRKASEIRNLPSGFFPWEDF